MPSGWIDDLVAFFVSEQEIDASIMSIPNSTAAGKPLGRVVGVLLVQRNPVVLDCINSLQQFLPPLKSVGFAAL
ncbi:MAG: hypothetical protein QXQ39_07880 [Conexivisphaerales archaeon]